MRLLVTTQVMREVSEATRRGRKERLELGGSLLAHDHKGEILVAYAIPTGPNADRGPGHVLTDASFQNTAIERIQRRFPRLTYAGDWHVHPIWLPKLSFTDLRTAEAILKDDGAHRERLVLLLGTAGQDGKPIVLAFLATLDAWRTVSAKQVEIHVVEEGSNEVLQHLDEALSPLDELIDAPAIEVTTIDHLDSSHIAAELAEIQRDLGADVTLCVAGDLLAAAVVRGPKSAVVLFPPEYPLGAPQVFSGMLDQGPLIPIELRHGWSSRHHLIDPVTEALSARAGYLRPKSKLQMGLAGLGRALLRGIAATLRSPRAKGAS